MATQRLEFRYWLAAHTLFEHQQDLGTEALWNHLHCLIDKHRRFSAPGETIRVEVLPTLRMEATPTGCANWEATPECLGLRRLLEAEPCRESSRSPSLAAGSGGITATVTDCRRLEDRSPELYRALKSFHGSDGVIGAVDLFGTRSEADLEALMNEATGYLSRFFDDHFIADADGLILFDAEAPNLSEAEDDESRAATPGFAGYVNISDLLRGQSPADRLGEADLGGVRNESASESAAPVLSSRGRSFVRLVGVGDIDFRAFVHPFVLDGVTVSDGSVSSTAVTRTLRPTFYLVGIIDDREFRSAAIRLRLGDVTNATLLLLGLLTLTPLLWYWTAGDRVVIGRFALLGVCTIPLVGIVLFTVLACAVKTNRVDEHALDGALEQVSNRIVALFDRELHGEIRRLKRREPELLERAERRERQQRPDERGSLRSLPRIVPPGDRTLTPLERVFYCDDADRQVDYDPDAPEIWSASLLDDDGRQNACLSEPGRGRTTRTPPLSLAFRDYFRGPKDGVLWRSPSGPRSRPVEECHLTEEQDDESLIPCLVDALPGSLPDPLRRRFSVGGLADGFEVSYFLDRIDSVVGGRITTILAIDTGRTETPVAMAAVSLNTLDRAVPPSHLDFAVVDRETGRTLFHSDDELAMTTYFVDDTGRDPALRSLLRSGARDTLDLDYAGIPVRAHIRPLRTGMPWALVVYRGHALEDRLAALTTALAALYTLLPMFLVAVLIGLVLLIWNCWAPGSLLPVPIVLGGIMAAGPRRLVLAAATVCAAAVCAGVLLLLFGASLSWLRMVWTGWRWVLPFLAVLLQVAAGVLVVSRTRAPAGSPSDPGDRTTMGRVFRLVFLAFVLGVVPSMLWFGHHRVALGVGLNHYLMDATLESIDRAREEYRRDMLRRHGASAAPPGDRTQRRWPEEQMLQESWLDRTVRPIVTSSELANRLMTYRALPPAVGSTAASLQEAFTRTFGYAIDSPPRVLSAADLDLWRLLAKAVGLLLFLAPIVLYAYSVCAVCTVVGRRRRGLVELPSADPSRQAPGAPQASPLKNARRPLRVIVVYSNLQRDDDAIRKLTERLGFLPSSVSLQEKAVSGTKRVVHRARGSDGRTLLCVFGDLKAVLADGFDGRALLDELERRTKDGSDVLIWSRVVPDYRYSDRLDPADRWFDRGRANDAAWRDRWNDLARDFHVMRSDASEDDECAASVFNQAWNESTHDERLQLYALAARGGVVDSRRTATLSSLVNRGIVRENPGTGVVECPSEAFREFIEHDIDHHELDTWRKRGDRGGWRFLWPPVAIFGALGLAFLAMANPEVRATLLTTLLALLPAALPLLAGRSTSTVGTTEGGSG